MTESVCAVLLHDDEPPVSFLAGILERQGITSRRARTCRELAEIFSRTPGRYVVFTGVDLPDGNWTDVLDLSGGLPGPVPVVVVARLVDIRFYVEVIERGAFDFIAPPFSDRDISHVFRCATSALGRAQVRAGAA